LFTKMSDDTVKDQTDNQTKWERHENGNIPCGAVYAGGKCYIVRVMHEGSRLVGSIIEGENCAYCGYKGVAYSHYEYQIFVETEIKNNTKLRWKWTDGTKFPENAIMGG
ncbi:DUF3421 domain-containing protein, partial [Salmonella enterica subsp. enterica serovar Typhimurium]|nr:DUF3421 domain-containing protein [Salmonella enterica subsp. enterica serovar Typhimurium]